TWGFAFVEALREHWVYRVAIVYAGALFVWIQAADYLNTVEGITEQTLARVTHLGLAALFPVVMGTWALEPLLRKRWARDRGEAPAGVPGVFGFLTSLRGSGLILGVVAGLWFGIVRFPPGPPQPAPPVEVPTDIMAAPHGLAILPILPEDTADTYLASVGDHLTRTLINHFLSYGVLKVPWPETVSHYAGSPLSPDSLRQLLGVDLLVSGTLGQRGDSVFLILNYQGAENLPGQVSCGVPWREGLDEIQLAELVTDRINIQLQEELGREFRATTLRLRTESEEAWRLVREGLDERSRAISLTRRNEFGGALRSLAQADSLFTEATGEDPNWPDPFLWKGRVYLDRVVVGIGAANAGNPTFQLSEYEVPPVLQAGLALVEEGIQLDPTYKEGYAAKADIMELLSSYVEGPAARERLFQEREAALATAIRGAPARPDARFKLALLYLDWGRFGEAEEQYEAALDQDVFRDRTPSDLFTLARIRLESGKDSLGFQACAEEFSTAEGWNRILLAECQLLFLAFGEGLDPDLPLARRLAYVPTPIPPWQASEAPSFSPNNLALLAGVFARVERPDSALALLDAAPEGGHEYDVGVLARLGKLPEAMEMLRSLPSPQLQSRVFDPLRGYPPFDSLLAERGGNP
ncbi:hypothetical protein ACFL0I_03670, partial [Gemmatimonadota bacterium]